MIIELEGGMVKNPNSFFDWEHIFFKESQQMIIERFCQHGINVYIDDGWSDGPNNGGGGMLEFVETLDEVVGGHMARWYRHNFADERKNVFRYVVVGNDAGFITLSVYNHYDHIVVDTSMYKTYFKRFAFTPRWQRVVLAKGVLHELGHSLGLMPITFKGVDNMLGGNYRWPESLTDEEYELINENYKSIMNYNYIFDVFSNRKLFDFSHGENGEPYDFDDWGHIYVPFFQVDDISYEEPIDETFDDYGFEDKEPEPVYKDWAYDENITTQYLDQITSLNLVQNIDSNLRIYLKTEDKNKNVVAFRVYIKPDVKPVPALWSLAGEGELNQDTNTLEFYSFENNVLEVLEMIE